VAPRKSRAVGRATAQANRRKSGEAAKPKATGTPRESLTIDDFSDIALLHLVDECTASEGKDAGFASSREIAELLNLETNAPASNVGIRLGFLSRDGVGLVEAGPRPTLWRLTDVGADLLSASLTAAQMRALQGLAEERAVALTTVLGEQLGRLREGERVLVRREFRHNFSRFGRSGV
jgi:hypothetical protein